MRMDQLAQLIQDVVRTHGFLPRFAQQLIALKEQVARLDDRVRQHGEDHEQIIEAFEALKPMLTKPQKRKEERRMSATKTIPQLNNEHEALYRLLDELGPRLGALGIFPTDQPEVACGRYRELLGEPLPADAPEDALDELGYRLDHLGPLATLLSALAARMEEERRRHEAVMKRLLGLCQQATVMITRLREERDRMKGLCAQAAAALKAKAASGA